ncbi:hypothetical protein [Streptomyces sp. NPDC021020]|uniref:hypothetical protein n=1 Tax=Streptomyces sp. NPDC021020 TaxID=3365109 RepID=UPI0037A6F16D
MRTSRAGAPALLLVLSAAALFATGACGKAGSGSSSGGSQLPAATTLAGADQQLHAYLESAMPVGGGEPGVRAGAVLPSSLARTHTPCDAGQATHLVTEVVVGASDGYATKVLGTLRTRGWLLPDWSSDAPTPGTRFTSGTKSGYRIQVEEQGDTVTLTAETPCLTGAPAPRRSDFPLDPPGDDA